MWKWLQKFRTKQDPRLVLIKKLKKKKLNLYSATFSTTSVFILKDDIIANIEMLKAIAEQDILSGHIYVENISKDSFITTTLSKWYTNNKCVISNNELLHTWLDIAYSLIEVTSKCKIDFNLRRLKPVIHHIEVIINTLAL